MHLVGLILKLRLSVVFLCLFDELKQRSQENTTSVPVMVGMDTRLSNSQLEQAHLTSHLLLKSREKAKTNITLIYRSHLIPSNYICE